MKYEVYIEETGHKRHYKSYQIALMCGMRLLNSLIKKGYIYGAHEFVITDKSNGHTFTINKDN